MCTVSYVPGADGYQIISNRDERFARASALPPQLKNMSTGLLLFPRDGEASGSWVAIHEAGHALVLLNGAFTAHRHKPPYRKSRGLVLLDLADSLDPLDSFWSYELKDIEPFTVVICTGTELKDCRWDGRSKSVSDPDPQRPHIWSSCTLYSPEVMVRRKGWFEAFLQTNPQPTLDDLLWLHQHGGEGDARNGFQMHREEGLGTVSITAIHMQIGSGFMKYLDLRTGTLSDLSISQVHITGTP